MPEKAGEIVELIGRAKKYDRPAFAELYRATVVPVYRYLSARLNSREEAEDLTQEVFLSALSSIQTLRAEDETGLLAWLFQIARHKLADHIRERQRKQTAPLLDADDLESKEISPDEAAESGEERAELLKALDELTLEQREVMICKYTLGYDNERTARLLGKNINAVNQLHHRALASLHRLLMKKENAK